MPLIGHLINKIHFSPNVQEMVRTANDRT